MPTEEVIPEDALADPEPPPEPEVDEGPSKGRSVDEDPPAEEG